MSPNLQNIVETFVDIATSDKEIPIDDMSLRALLICCDTARLANGALIEMSGSGQAYEVTATRAEIAGLFDDDGPMIGGVWNAMKRGNYSSEEIDYESGLSSEASMMLKLVGAKTLHYFPIHRRGAIAGVLVLFDRTHTTRSEDFSVYVQGVADAAMGVVESERRAARAVQMVGQLSTALDSRVLIEQAKGIIAERYAMNPTQAFGWIRSLARNERGKLSEVAQRIVSSADKRPSEHELMQSTSLNGIEGVDEAHVEKVANS